MLEDFAWDSFSEKLCRKVANKVWLFTSALEGTVVYLFYPIIYRVLPPSQVVCRGISAIKSRDATTLRLQIDWKSWVLCHMMTQRYGYTPKRCVREDQETARVKTGSSGFSGGNKNKSQLNVNQQFWWMKACVNFSGCVRSSWLTYGAK